MRARIITGVGGVDKMLNGGIPEGNQVILAGGPGAGKTLFCFEMLYKNAKAGVNAALVSFDESRKQLVMNAMDAFPEFADLNQLVDAGKIEVYDMESVEKALSNHPEMNEEYVNVAVGERERTLSAFFKQMEINLPKLLGKSQAKLIVIDNLTAVRNLIQNDYDYRNFVTNMSRILKGRGFTSLAIVDLADPREESVSFGPEFFAFDGIITMYYSLGAGKKVALMEVVKMRGTGHSHKAVPYEILPSGIKTLNVGMED
jgi:circadian clock protein KaiC